MKVQPHDVSGSGFRVDIAVRAHLDKWRGADGEFRHVYFSLELNNWRVSIERARAVGHYNPCLPEYGRTAWFFRRDGGSWIERKTVRNDAGDNLHVWTWGFTERARTYRAEDRAAVMTGDSTYTVVRYRR